MSPQTSPNAGPSPSVDENRDWCSPVVQSIDIVETLLRNESKIRYYFKEGNLDSVREIITNGQAMIKTLQQLETRFSQAHEQLEQCKADWTEALRNRTGELAEVDKRFDESRKAKDAELTGLSKRLQDTSEKVLAKDDELERLRLEAHVLNADLESSRQQRQQDDEEYEKKATQQAELAQALFRREEQLRNDQIAVEETKRDNDMASVSLRDQQVALFGIFSKSEFSTGSDTSPASSITDLALRATSIVNRCMQLADANTQIQERLDREREAVLKEKQRVEEFSGYLDAKNRQINTQAATHENQSRDLRSSQQQLSDLQARYQMLSGELQSTKSSYQSLEAELKDCRNDLWRVKEEKDTLQNNKQEDIDALVLERNKVSQFNIRTAKLEGDLKEVSQKYLAEKDISLQRHCVSIQAELEIDRLRRQIKTLQEALEVTITENNELPIVKSQVSSLEEGFQALDHQKSELEKHYDTAVTTAARHEARADMATAEIGQLRDKVQELDTNKRSSQKETAKLVAELSSAKTSNGQLTAINKKLEEDNNKLNTRIATQETQLGHLSGVQETNKSLEDRLSAEGATLRASEHRYQILQASSQGLEDTITSLRQALARQTPYLDDVIDQLSRKDAELQSAADRQAQFLDKSSDISNSLRDQLSAKDTELQACKKDHELLQIKSKNMEESNGSLRQVLDRQTQDLTESANTSENLGQVIGELQTQVQNAKQVQETMNRHKVALETELREIMESRDSFEAELEDSKNEILSMVRERRELIEARDKLEAERQDLSTRANELANRSLRYRQERESLREEVNRLIATRGASPNRSVDHTTSDNLEAGTRRLKRTRMTNPELRTQLRASNPTQAETNAVSVGSGNPAQARRHAHIDTPIYRWAIEDVRNPGFTADPIPTSILRKLRQQMQVWDTRRSDWVEGVTSGAPKCADSLRRRSKSDWLSDDKHACRNCVENNLVCVAVTKGFIKLLPIQRGDGEDSVGPDDVRFWMAD